MVKFLALFIMGAAALLGQGRGDPNWHTAGPPKASAPGSCAGTGNVYLLTDATYRLCIAGVVTNPFAMGTVTSLGGLTGALTFVNDTNVTITPSGSTLTLGWTSTLAKARQNATTVYTDQAGTFGAFLYDFAASTMKLPSSAGCSASSSAMLCYDTTNKNEHIYANAADAIAAVFSSTAGITNGDCAQISFVSGFIKIVSAGGPCTVGGGGGTVNTGTGGEFAYYPSSTNAVGSSGKTVPSGDVVGTTDSQTLSGKKLTNPSLGPASTPSAITQGYLNDTTTGTTVKLVARLSTVANDSAIKVSGSDTDALGICISGCSTSGTGEIAVGGTALCTFDNTTVKGDWVQYTAATAQCHDAGATRPTSGTTILGRVTDSGASGDHRVDVDIAAIGGSAGGNSTSAGTFGSNPGTCTDGDVRFPSDSYYLLRCVSNAWVQYGPIYPLFPPPSVGSFSWVNQGAATSNNTNGGIFMQCESSGSHDVNAMVMSAPSTPYTITVLIQPLMSNTTTYAGLLWRDSGTGKLATFYLVFTGGSLGAGARKDNSPTSANSSYSMTIGYQFSASPIWLRIQDNGTNHIRSVSVDGQHFLTIHTVSRTDFLASPNQIGFFCNANSSGLAPAFTILSWLQQ